MTELAGVNESIIQAIEFVSLIVEVLAIVIIVIAILYSTGIYVSRLLRQTATDTAYHDFKVQLGKGLLLGLEILVAADVVRTVALHPTLESASVLGLLVLIRIFLSWSLVVEMEGRWPWQQPRPTTGAAHDEM